jgi:hypothetical protein
MSVRDEYAGRAGNCKKCKEALQVPFSKPIEPEVKKVAKPKPEKKYDFIVPTKQEVAEMQAADPNYRHDAYGAWCPHCGNRCSEKSSSGTSVVTLLTILVAGGLFMSYQPGFAVVALLIGVLLSVFLPREWKCNQCKHRWKA